MAKGDGCDENGSLFFRYVMDCERKAAEGSNGGAEAKVVGCLTVRGCPYTDFRMGAPLLDVSDTIDNVRDVLRGTEGPPAFPTSYSVTPSLCNKMATPEGFGVIELVGPAPVVEYQSQDEEWSQQDGELRVEERDKA